MKIQSDNLLEVAGMLLAQQGYIELTIVSRMCGMAPKVAEAILKQEGFIKVHVKVKDIEEIRLIRPRLREVK